MKTTILLAATLAAFVGPGLSLAQGCNHMTKDQQAASCTPGQTWDAQTGRCVTVTG